VRRALASKILSKARVTKQQVPGGGKGSAPKTLAGSGKKKQQQAPKSLTKSKVGLWSAMWQVAVMTLLSASMPMDGCHCLCTSAEEPC
jgi:hypothetical protein